MSIASSLDLAAGDAIVLHDPNKLTLRLLPCDVLARVALVASRDRTPALVDADRELLGGTLRSL